MEIKIRLIPRVICPSMVHRCQNAVKSSKATVLHCSVRTVMSEIRWSKISTGWSER